jgi:hypothetical protein
VNDRWTLRRFSRPTLLLLAFAALLILYVAVRLYSAPPSADTVRDTMCLASRIGLPCQPF